MDGVEGMANSVEPQGNNVVASENVNAFNNETPLPVSSLGRNPPTCYPQQTLNVQDLLPSNENAQVQQFNNANPAGEGVLKGVNLLAAGFHHGINTIGQSLRNSNLNLRAEPANPQVPVSPWMNTTIGPDLDRKNLEIDVCNGQSVSNNNLPVGNDMNVNSNVNVN